MAVFGTKWHGFGVFRFPAKSCHRLAGEGAGEYTRIHQNALEYTGDRIFEGEVACATHAAGENRLASDFSVGRALGIKVYQSFTFSLPVLKFSGGEWEI